MRSLSGACGVRLNLLFAIQRVVPLFVTLVAELALLIVALARIKSETDLLSVWTLNPCLNPLTCPYFFPFLLGSMSLDLGYCFPVDKPSLSTVQVGL